MRRHVYFYTHITPPCQDAVDRLVGDPALWLPPPAEPDDEGWEILLHAEGVLPVGLATRPARVILGEASVARDRLLLPLMWQAAERGSLFPVLHADLALEALGDSGCHLSLMGSYRPPLSVVGGAADALHGHRVAEATVRRFVLDVADRLTSVGAR